MPSTKQTGYTANMETNNTRPLDETTRKQLDQFYKDYKTAYDNIVHTYELPEGFFSNYAWKSYEPVDTETLKNRLTTLRDVAEEALDVLEKAEAGEPVDDIAFTSEYHSNSPEEIVTFHAKNQRSENISYFPDYLSEGTLENLETQSRAWEFVVKAGSQPWALYYKEILGLEQTKKLNDLKAQMLEERGLTEAYEIDQQYFD